MVAGRIIPALVATPAAINGCVTAELIKLASGDVEKFKNSFINLALPLFVNSEPLPTKQTFS